MTVPAALKSFGYMVVIARADCMKGCWSDTEAVVDHALALLWESTLTGSSCHFGFGVVACGRDTIVEERLWDWRRSSVLEDVHKRIGDVCYKDPRKVEVVDLEEGSYVDTVLAVLVEKDFVVMRK